MTPRKPSAKKTKPVKCWAITKNGAIYQGVWKKHGQALDVLEMWNSNMFRVIPVLITPAPAPQRRKK